MGLVNKSTGSKKKREKKRDSALVRSLKSINYLGMGKHRAEFFHNTATMMEAGLPLVETLQTYLHECRNRTMRKVIGQIAEEVESGTPFWSAMESRSLFTPFEISLVRVGEEAGNLTRNMSYLVEQEEKNHALKQKVKIAMIYPTIVIVLMIGVVLGMGMFVLPNLVSVLFALNVELPLATRLLIKFTDVLNQHGTIIAPGIIGGLIFLMLLSKFTRFKVVTQWFVMHIPGIGKLLKEATIARFGVILGGLLQAGVPLMDAMESLIEATQVARYKKLYIRLHEKVAVGDSFGTSFHALGKTSNALPISVRQLVITGEKSGTLSEILLKVGDIYDKRASETAQKLPVILEPALLILIAGLVAGIAFAIITPIYGVIGNVS